MVTATVGTSATQAVGHARLSGAVDHARGFVRCFLVHKTRETSTADGGYSAGVELRPHLLGDFIRRQRHDFTGRWPTLR